MTLPDIKLDDRTFEDLVAEAKRRIPGYTPEWTDLNETDPGITLVQLFAWLSEMIIWRLNRVPEKNFIKFLELIGIEPAPPAAATAELTFKLTAKNLAEAKLIDQGTQVALTEQVDGKAVVFETDDNLYAVSAELKDVQSFDGARFEIVTEAFRVPGRYFYAFGARPQRNSALYLGFDEKFPTNQPVSLMVHVYTTDLINEGKGLKAFLTSSVGTDGSEQNGTNVPEDPASSSPPAILVWEYWAGDSAKWLPLTGVRDGTANFTRDGKVVFDAPVSFASAKVGLLRKDDDKERFWIRVRIEQILGAGFEIVPRLEDVLLNTIKATNAVTITDELLGASNGLPNQKFKLANTPVLLDRFDLQVDEGDGFKSWTMVLDFGASGRNDLHFTLAPAAGEIAFGNGEHGKIPGRLTQRNDEEKDLPNIKAANYRWGGGAGGNAGPGKITSLESSVPYVDSVTNLRPADGGSDGETVDAAKLRAPETIRSRSRAVTSSDFEFLAVQTPGARIRRAHTLPLRHPDIEPIRPSGSAKKTASSCSNCDCSGCAGCGSGPVRPSSKCGCAQTQSSSASCGGPPAKQQSGSTLLPVPGVVTVVVVPEALKGETKPLPSADTLRLVGQWLNQHRLITTELYVAAPKYKEIEIEARVIAKPTANSGQVAETLRAQLLEYFHPLTGGKDGNGWEFGGTVYFSEVYRRILDTPGVMRLEAGAVTTYVNGQRQPACTDIFVNDDELVYSKKHNIMVSYS
ncbi:MAG TPA: putative baseplate assembly protein [Pyrinomonadaceae bacterium]|nr:putative baseplate assembly protein [Pyrinomonadaceae bacterium]